MPHPTINPPRRRWTAWHVAALVTLGVSIAKGIRFPNRYASTHYLFNYDYGMVKRGLVGQLLRLIDTPFTYSYGFICIFSLATLFVTVGLLWGVVRRLIDREEALSSQLAVVYVSSLALVYLSHTVGYFDLIGLSLALVVLRLRTFASRTLATVLLASVAIMVHEASFVLFLPLMLFACVASIGGVSVGPRLAILSAVAVLEGVLTFVVSRYMVLSSQDCAQLIASIQPKTDFTLVGVADALATEGATSLSFMLSNLSTGAFLVANVDSLLIVAPTVVVFLTFSAILLRTAGCPRYVGAGAFVASLSPLAMHFLGVDMHRWDSMMITTSFLVLVILRNASVEAVPPRSYHLPLLVAVIVLNCSSTTFLFDGYHVKQFPFFEHRTYLMDLLSGTARFPPFGD